jgi:hypothetical protein
VRDGRDTRVAGDYPSEVEPLVSDLNALIDQRERARAARPGQGRRPRARAEDAARGARAGGGARGRAGHAELAALLRQQVERMRGQVDYHLAQAGAPRRRRRSTHCSVRDSAEGLARTLRRLHAERGLAIDVAVDPSTTFRGRREDSTSCSATCSTTPASGPGRACASVGVADSSVVLTVDDDGPGLDPALRERVLQRGVRADESAPGTGIGLAIVRDLAELYGGRVALERAPEGGLRAELRLPARGRAGVSDAG